MLKLLQMLFLGHAHKWNVVETVEPFGIIKILYCEKCNKLKKEKLYY